MTQQYDGSCILYPVQNPTTSNSKVTLEGMTWYVTICRTGIEKPSHKLFLENENRLDFTGAALFKNDPDKKSILGGSISMHKQYWIDVYLNESKTTGDPPYLMLRFTEKKPKNVPTQQPTTQQTINDLDDQIRALI